MIITAKFNGRCAECGEPTPAGSQIEYLDRKAYHPACAPLPPLEPGLIDCPVIQNVEQWLTDHGWKRFSWEEYRNGT